MKFYTSKIAVERQKMEDKSSFYVSSISIKYVAFSIPPKKEEDWIVDEQVCLTLGWSSVVFSLCSLKEKNTIVMIIEYKDNHFYLN